MVDAILQAPMHVITTMRSRMEYVQEASAETGKTMIRKVGLAPIQRPGMEYEFDVVADVDIDHRLHISKSRCSALADANAIKPGPSFWAPLLAWLETGSGDALREVERLTKLKLDAKRRATEGQPPRLIADELGVEIGTAIEWINN
jgi:hypothetical protein